MPYFIFRFLHSTSARLRQVGGGTYPIYISFKYWDVAAMGGVPPGTTYKTLLCAELHSAGHVIRQASLLTLVYDYVLESTHHTSASTCSLGTGYLEGEEGLRHPDPHTYGAKATLMTENFQCALCLRRGRTIWRGPEPISRELPLFNLKYFLCARLHIRDI